MWLSLTWPGAGHVYAGITEKGAILCGVSVVLFALSLTLIGPALGLVLWLGLSLYAALDISATLTASGSRGSRAAARATPSRASRSSGPSRPPGRVTGRGRSAPPG